MLLERIAQLETQFDTREPEVLAFIPEEGRFDRLRREAAALLAKYPDPQARPPLFGLFAGVKDIFRVDGFPTRAGSQLPPDALRGPQAESVRLVNEAGALIIGKTVTTEFAYFAPGLTRNPHNPAHTPGGSSSGSAAAVAAGLCDLALGTQTIGSITRPAAFCGVVGYKPSYDRISRAGVIPLAGSVDHVGVFAPTVEMATRAARVLCLAWTEPPAPSRQPALGIPEGPYLEKASAEGLAHFWAVVARLETAGYRVVRVAAMPDFADISARHNDLVAAEATAVHADWFAAYGDRYHPKTAELLARGRTVPAARIGYAQNGRATLRSQLSAILDLHALDLFISPSAPGPAPAGLDSTGNPVMNLPWTHSGLPTLQLPAGKNNAGLPLGLQLTARWFHDEHLLAWGAAMGPLLG